MNIKAAIRVMKAVLRPNAVQPAQRDPVAVVPAVGEADADGRRLAEGRAGP